MMNYRFMNYALEHTEGNEFRVLYFIANTLNMKEVNRCKIYNEVIADYLNMNKRSVMRMTKNLEEKGLLKKDLVYDNGKSKVFYSLNYAVLNDKVGTDDALILDKTDTDNALILDKSVTLNKNIKEQTKTNNINTYIHNSINTEEHINIGTEYNTCIGTEHKKEKYSIEYPF